jgi:hypothetical protein
MGQKIGQPGRVIDVGLAARHVLDMLGVCQHQLKIAIAEDVPDRLPVDPGARVACIASSARSSRSLTSTSVAPPTRICGYLCSGNNRITISGTYLLEIS